MHDESVPDMMRVPAGWDGRPGLTGFRLGSSKSASHA